MLLYFPVGYSKPQPVRFMEVHITINKIILLAKLFMLNYKLALDFKELFGYLIYFNINYS